MPVIDLEKCLEREKGRGRKRESKKNINVKHPLAVFHMHPNRD